ncbi:DNA topoisomerase III, partial [Desulfovibrio desulfuricans]
TTRALTCKFNAQLSAGRVQTPTLAMIVDREEEIRKFIPKEYFTLRVDTGYFTLDYRKNSNASIPERKQAEELARRLKQKQ